MSVNRLMCAALALLLVIASGSAAALGLGQIQLKSKLGEPLLAEILIVSSDPSELENLRAGLASPETFARIGLDLPHGVVADLQFTQALDDAGRPVIRVTSVVPIEEPLLTFLVEVDWGQGRLVREYSTLMDAPRTVSAPAQPSIQAPTQAQSSAIVRDAVSAPPDGTGTSAAIPDGDSPIAESADPFPAGATAAAVQSASPPTQYGAVQSGEHLSTIAAGLEMGGNLQQKMIALLQANPEAFIGGNIHLLKQGAVLQVPSADEIAAISAAQAAAQVREQTRAWRVAAQPVPQPQVAEVPGADGAASSDSRDAVAAAAAPADGARLEIVPPGANDASRAGTQSGISAGGEGDMVRQELQTTTETLAAREAELAELKSRIDTLEQLQSDQQKLLSMKDAELASAQQQLAQSQPDLSESAGSAMPWLAGGTLLVLFLVGAWWWRRRADSASRFRAPAAPAAAEATSSLAGGFPTGSSSPSADEPERSVLNPEAVQSAPAKIAEQDADVPVPAKPVPPAAEVTPSDVAQLAVPAWHAAPAKNRLNDTKAAAKADIDPPAAPRSAATPSAPVLADPPAPGTERLELARAYLDLGDEDSARQLLGELEVSGSLQARQEATRLLRELG